MEASQFLEIFTHVRILIAMIISLSIARILSGLARFLQHPKQYKLSVLHLLWVFSILFELILFWWWGVRSTSEIEWTFGMFVLRIIYAVTLFLMSALIFPDHIAEYKGYQDFFINRRYWFFALLATTWLIDIAKATFTGVTISQNLAQHAGITLVLCALAVYFKNPKIQIAIVLIYIYRQYLSM